jgi:hypothetical protein
MKYPITLSDSTIYFEKHFLMIEESPTAYVSAFREAQFESIQKRRKEKFAFGVIFVAALLAWLMSFMHLIFLLSVIGVVWGLNHWRGKHETTLLERTFQLAIMGKDNSFQEYMWRHRDRRPVT